MTAATTTAAPPLAQSRAGQVARASLISLTFLMVWFLFYAFLLTPLQAHHDQGVLYSQLREELAAETGPIGGVITPGAPVALMNLPAAGIKREVVVEGTTSSNLTAGPGHERDTVLPGQEGLSVIMGRSALFGAPFGSIASLHKGAVITFTTSEGVSHYVVQDVRYAGQTGAPEIAPGGGQLQLVTAESTGWRSGWAPAKAVFVDAALTSKPYGNMAGGLANVPTAEEPMKGDTSSLYALVLWLPLLAAAAVAVTWAYARWGRWQAWVAGVPLLLATLWGVSKVAIQLLPNLT
jgi:sortase A